MRRRVNTLSVALGSGVRLVKQLIRLRWSVLVVFIVGSSVALSVSYQRVPIQHRSPVAVQVLVEPLLGKGSSIVADNDSVLISAPPADIPKLKAFINSVDVAQQVMRVSVYRGAYPHKASAVIATTRASNNQRFSTHVYAGQWLHIGETNLVIVPIEQAQETYQQVIYASGSDKYQVLKRDTGIYLRAYLASKQQVRIEADITTSSGGANHKQVKPNDAVSVYELQRSINTRMTIPLNQWSLLTQQQDVHYQPIFNGNAKVYSTQSSAVNKQANQQSVWLKIELLNEK